MMPPKRGRLILRTALVTLAVAALAGALAAALVIRQGWYDVGAVKQHWQPVFTLLENGLRYSVRHHAREIVAPERTSAMAQQGVKVYARHCVQCHGAPGVAPRLASLALQPSPGPLVHMTRRWQPNELYWIISNGIKMTGMQAWRFHLSEREIWSVVALIERLPGMTPEEGQALFATPPEPVGEVRMAVGSPDAERGRVALAQYACQSCHVLPGVPGPRVDVGPSLKEFARQRYVAGRLPNTEDNLVRWIRDPQEVKLGSAMPSLQVTERDARDMARWLLRDRSPN